MIPSSSSPTEYLLNARTLQTRDPLQTFELAHEAKGHAGEDGQLLSLTLLPRWSFYG